MASRQKMQGFTETRRARASQKAAWDFRGHARRPRGKFGVRLPSMPHDGRKQVTDGQCRAITNKNRQCSRAGKKELPFGVCFCTQHFEMRQAGIQVAFVGGSLVSTEMADYMLRGMMAR